MSRAEGQWLIVYEVVSGDHDHSHAIYISERVALDRAGHLKFAGWENVRVRKREVR